MTILSILLISLLCLSWLIVIGASQLAEAASLIDENNNQENE